MCDAHNDVYNSGNCRTCGHARNAQYRRRRRLAMALLHSAEARGFSGSEALALVQHVDIGTVLDCADKGFRPAPDNVL
jgi:hypothetical protein